MLVYCAYNFSKILCPLEMSVYPDQQASYEEVGLWNPDHTDVPVEECTTSEQCFPGLST